MIRTTPCPDPQTVRRLVEGQAPLDDQNRFAEHLEQCPRCAEDMDRLLAGDTLMEAMQTQTTATDTPPSSALQALIQRARRMVSAPDPITQSVADGASATTTGEESFAFLSPPQAADEIGRLGGYRVLKVLGTGGMGIVFQAEDLKLKRQVALKVMKPDAANKPGAKERFVREAQTAAALEHENVVAIFQVDEDRGVPFLAMPLLKGVSLEERLKTSGALPMPQVLRIGVQAACGLDAAHERGLIHRDIKPGNLWLEPDEDGRVKILDFGLARLLADDVHLTRSGTIVGTPAYMAPEQARGEKVDHRCDLFSLGVVLYRMCTGQLPFRGENTMAVLTSLAMDTPTPVRELNPSVPPALAELIMRLLNKAPSARPVSAREVAERLQAIDPTPVKESPKPRRRWGRVIAAGLLLALLPLGWLFGGTLIRIVTDKGIVVIEVDDPKMEVIVKENGAVIKEGPGGREVTVAAGEHELDVTVKDVAGTLHFFTKKFTLSRGGKEVVNIRQEMAQAKPLPPGNAERQAAEWVLSVGGEVGIIVKDGVQTVLTLKNLPAGPTVIATVQVANKDRVTDQDLEHLKALQNLRRLDLYLTPVGDAGMVHLKDLTSLEVLSLWGTRVGDAGMAHLRGLTKLTDLNLDGTRVGDAGLAHIQTLTNLTNLRLGNDPVGDAGLANLRVLTKLTRLNLRGSRVGDLGMAHLKDLPLVWLDLQSTRVGDAGLKQLSGLSNLQELNLIKTPVSLEGVKWLADALPGCKIVSDHGTFEPKSVPANDRKAAEWVLSVGGSLYARTADKYQEIRDAKDLPKGPFWVEEIKLGDDQRFTDQGLESLKGLSRLTILNFARTKVTDAGLRHVESLPQLQHLELIGTRVTEAGVVRLKALSQLESLGLGELPISDAGLEQLKTLQKLTSLGLTTTRVTDAGLVHLKALPNLNSLFLMQTAVTDAGLEQLKTMPNLTRLWLGQTKMSDVGLEYLTALPNLQFLELDRTAVTDAGLAHLKRCRNLRGLTLRVTRIGDAGVEHLKGLTGLERLHLDHTEVSDAGLEHLKGLTNLRRLSLGETRVSDAGLVHLRGMTRLETLELLQTRISDASLKNLAQLPMLTDLILTDTNVSAQGFATLKATFPNASLAWSERNRGAAEAVLALGGTVHVRLKGNPNDRPIKVAADLPTESFQLTHVGLVGVTKPLKDLLSKLAALADPEFDRLEVLDLTATTVSDADLESLGPLTSLKELLLARTAVTDAGLVHLKDMKNLNKLVLDGSAIRGSGIAHLKDLPGLTDLRVGCASLTDLFVKPLGDLKKLERLSLTGSNLTDVGLKELHGLTSLKELDLTGTKVTAAGVAELQKVLPKCKVISDVSEK